MKRHLLFHHMLAKLSLYGLFASTASLANPLADYVHAPNRHIAWSVISQRQQSWGTLTRLSITTQRWRGHDWKHQLVIVSPTVISHPETAFLLVAGDGDGGNHIERLKTLAERGGTLAAVLTNVPNQPLYDGRKEDALIAFSFNQYLQSGDESWPLLFPMVESVCSAMDILQLFTYRPGERVLDKFVVGGASKRGWTTWLTAAVDDRVKAIAPMVIDVLNMKPQLQWSEQIYGHQSVKIRDYTELNLHRRHDSPAMQKLRSWVDPYEYRHLLTMPKLLLLGTNDPYWTVDSLRHYWHQLPEPKLLYQTPNAGHNLNGGDQALQTLAAFYEMVVHDETLPKLSWRFDYNGKRQVKLQLVSTHKARAAHLWTSLSDSRDFRPASWHSETVSLTAGADRVDTELTAPGDGYKAFLLEVEMQTRQGKPYKLSTEARVAPDTEPCYCWRGDDVQASKPSP